MTMEERNIKLKHFITCMKCEVSGKVCDDNCPTQYEAGNMGEIIENLEAISKILEQESCEDCISRAETVQFLINHSSDFEDVKIRMAFQTASSLINNPHNLPSVQPKTGHWIYGENEYGIDGYHCDKCGFFVRWDYAHKFINYIKDYKFCPKCSAKMIEPQESEE